MTARELKLAASQHRNIIVQIIACNRLRYLIHIIDEEGKCEDNLTSWTGRTKMYDSLLEAEEELTRLNIGMVYLKDETPHLDTHKPHSKDYGIPIVIKE